MSSRTDREVTRAVTRGAAWRMASVGIVALMGGFSAPAFAQQPADQTPPQKPKEAETGDVVVVTGVFGETAIEKAPISINVVTEEQLAQQVPVSGADVLKNVPGVFVNSSLGEIRNVVFSRGVSANSLDGAGGYFYVSLQEDGLPVETVTAGNFGPDYFYRPDITLARLEGLRGGTASITGPNAPGGIFNYISKTGKSSPGTEIQAKYGLEGDGENPYYRLDAYTGGRIGDSDLYYAVGGFYRKSDGARDPGYALNDGGQIKANLLWDYDTGSLNVGLKVLDDHNAWFEFVPAFGYNDPKIAAPFSNTSSVLPPANAHCTQVGSGQQCWDPSNGVHEEARALSLNWEQDLGNDFHFQNLTRYSDNKARWNTGGLIFAVPITDAALNVGGLGTTFLNTPLFFSFTPSTISLRNPDGSLAAAMNYDSIIGYTVTTNNLPSQDIMPNAILAQAALTQNFRSESFVDQATFTAKLGDHNIAFGAYASQSKFNQQSYSSGFGVSALVPQPYMYDVTMTVGSTTYQVTDPSGFANQQGLGGSNGGDQTQVSAFLSDSWDVTDRLTIDAGLRYETLKYDITSNQVAAGNRFADPGPDGNILTLWDNAPNAPLSSAQVKRDFEFLNYSGSVSYEISDDLQTYIRYTRGKKAPDYSVISSIDTPAEISTVFPEPQLITQTEIGIKYQADTFSLQAFPFFSELSNVADSQVFIYGSGPQAGQFYSPPPVFGAIETYGVEFVGDWEITDQLTIRGTVTLQEPKASNFGTYTQGPLQDGTDDSFATTPDGDADNNPKVIVRSTVTYRPVDDLSLFATYSYLGDRAANRNNAFYLPAFSTVDIGANWTINELFSVQANVTNVFDEIGIMSWAGNTSAGYVDAFNRQGITAAQVNANPNAQLHVLAAQPRAFWLTASAKF